MQAKPAVHNQSMPAAVPGSLRQLRSVGSDADQREQPQHPSVSRHSTAEPSQQQPVEAGAGPHFERTVSSHRVEKQDHSEESTQSYQQTPALAQPLQAEAVQEMAPDSGSRPVAESRAVAPGTLPSTRVESHASTEPATEHPAQPSQPALSEPEELSAPHCSTAELHSSSPAEAPAHAQPSYEQGNSPHSDDGSCHSVQLSGGSTHSAAAGRQPGAALPGCDRSEVVGCMLSICCGPDLSHAWADILVICSMSAS